MCANRRPAAASMLLVCLFALAAQFVPRAAASSSCCATKQSCCCRRDAAKPAWRSAPSCGESCGCAAGKFVPPALPFAAARARGVVLTERASTAAEPQQPRSLSHSYLAFLYQLPPPRD